MEFLEGLLAGFEAGVGVEEGVEAGSVGFVELVASAQQREPGPEHLGVEGGLGAFRRIGQRTRRRRPARRHHPPPPPPPPPPAS